MTKNLIIFALLLTVVVVAAFFYGQALNQGPEVSEVLVAELPQVIVDANAAIEAGEYERAQSLLETIAIDDPAFLLACQQLAVVHIRRDDLEAAERALARALLIMPNDPGLHLDLSGVKYRKGEFVAAETEVLRALELSPGAIRAVYKVGLYRVAQGRLAEGVDAYHRAITSHGELAEVEYGLAELMRLRDDQPDLPAAHYALAFFARTLGRDDLELDSLERFIELEPEGPIADQARRALEQARRASDG